MNYAHEIIGTHGGPEQNPGAKPLVCISLYIQERNDETGNADRKQMVFQDKLAELFIVILKYHRCKQIRNLDDGHLPASE